MTFSVLIFAWRKAGTTPAQFREHYENSHIPLIKSLAGDLFPLTHARSYIARSPSSSSSSDDGENDAEVEYPAQTLVGSPADFGYDVFAELTWEGQEEFGQFMVHMAQPEIARQIQEDEDKFLDRDKMRAVIKGETVVTSK